MPRGHWHPKLRKPRISMADRFWPKVDKSGDCWEWQGSINKGGYGKVGAPGGKADPSRLGSHMLSAHRVAWVLTNGPIPDGLWVLHHCDNRRCVRPDHLYIGDARDNMRDCMERGRLRPGSAGSGEQSPQHKVSDAQCDEIRALIRAGWLQRLVAAKFGIHQSQVSRIARGHRRKVA